MKDCISELIAVKWHPGCIARHKLTLVAYLSSVGAVTALVGALG